MSMRRGSRRLSSVHAGGHGGRDACSVLHRHGLLPPRVIGWAVECEVAHGAAAAAAAAAVDTAAAATVSSPMLHHRSHSPRPCLPNTPQRVPAAPQHRLQLGGAGLRGLRWLLSLPRLDLWRLLDDRTGKKHVRRLCCVACLKCPCDIRPSGRPPACCRRRRRFCLRCQLTAPPLQCCPPHPSPPSDSLSSRDACLSDNCLTNNRRAPTCHRPMCTSCSTTCS